MPVNVKRLLEELQDSTDLALDFIENEVGGNSFAKNWRAVRRNKNPVEMVSHWMQKIGAQGDPEQVVKVIDELASRETHWLTPFTSPVPPSA